MDDSQPGAALARVVLPAGLANLDFWSFAFCPNLTSVYFRGAAPASANNPFWQSGQVTVYRLASASAWPSPPEPWWEKSTAIWNTPTLSGFSPDHATANATVTITGTDFIDIGSVRIGSVNCAFKVVSSTEITFSIPSGATTGIITVHGTAGDATSNADLVVDTATFASWRTSVFTPEQLADPGISDPMACPADDGIPNLMKYALRLDPSVCGSRNLPTTGKDSDYLIREDFRQSEQLLLRAG